MNTVLQELLKGLEMLEEVEKLYLQIPFQDIGNELDMPVGMHVGVNILPELKKMKEELEALRSLVGTS